MAGDTVVSLFLTTAADRIGRRRVLVAGSILMVGAGLAFAFTSNFLFLIVAGTIGVISPSGNEVGPFLSIEQAALAHVVSRPARTAAFAWYTLTGSVRHRHRVALRRHASRRPAGIPHSGAGKLPRRGGAVCVSRRTAGAPFHPPFVRHGSGSAGSDSPAPVLTAKLLGVGHSRSVVFKLAGLFALDAFGGGFVVQSLAAYWFYLRFGVNPGTLGAIFFGANVFAGISALLASRLAARFGLVRTMVFTHLPSNVLLILVPLMPTLPLAILVLLLRFSISQMDVPTRQSYLMAVVRPEERSAAAGITGVARTSRAPRSLRGWWA